MDRVNIRSDEIRIIMDEESDGDLFEEIDSVHDSDNGLEEEETLVELENLNSENESDRFDEELQGNDSVNDTDNEGRPNLDDEILDEGDLGSENQEALVVNEPIDDGWREWNENDDLFTEHNYSLDSGYKPPAGDKPENEIEFFQLFFTDQLLEEIIKETNRFAKEKIAANTPLQKKSVWWSWQDITLTEFKAFIGVVINMGIHHKPEIDDYFTPDWIDSQPFFKSVFSRDRFKQIFWSLHLNPPPTGRVIGAMSRSAKVRNVVLYLDKKYREYFIPNNKVSIDESTVGFKGRVVFKVYNKDKPTKWGIKIFVASDSITGYICAIEPYLGKGTTDNMVRPDLGVTSRVVLHLVQKMKDDYGSVEGMHVFTDRLYTNLDVAEALLNQKVHLTGTIMRNRRGLPEEVKPKRKGGNSKGSKKKKKRTVPTLKLKRGEMKSYRKDDKYSLVIWKDKNEVSMLSTLYDNTTETIRRVKKRGVVEELVKPSVVCRYNESMGGVDVADHYIASYSFTRKSVKWWRKVNIYFHFLLIKTKFIKMVVYHTINNI